VLGPLAAAATSPAGAGLRHQLQSQCLLGRRQLDPHAANEALAVAVQATLARRRPRVFEDFPRPTPRGDLEVDALEIHVRAELVGDLECRLAIPAAELAHDVVPILSGRAK
jgi:hypothetical protein